jgi:hypothetical protein
MPPRRARPASIQVARRPDSTRGSRSRITRSTGSRETATLLDSRRSFLEDFLVSGQNASSITGISVKTKTDVSHEVMERLLPVDFAKTVVELMKNTWKGHCPYEVTPKTSRRSHTRILQSSSVEDVRKGQRGKRAMIQLNREIAHTYHGYRQHCGQTMSWSW